jgi:MarR family 2-MHQ and catechol resistance regulon transcriptional repressor
MSTHYHGSEQEIKALDAYIKLSRAAESVNIAVNAHLHHYQLTVSQFGVMEAIYHLGPLQIGELGQKILKSSGNMTLVIDNLQKRKLVERRQKEIDRRCTEIHLTEAGAALIEQIFPRHVAQVVETFAVLSPEEQSQLGELCRRLGTQQNR